MGEPTKILCLLQSPMLKKVMLCVEDYDMRGKQPAQMVSGGVTL